MKIIFCDNHLLVVFKPAGISTQPHQAHEENLLDQAKAWLKKQFQKSGNVFLEPIHRLDKPVSGLVLFARTSKALSRLQEAMRQRKIEKTYFAWIEGILPHEKGTLEHYLFHGEHRAKIVDKSHPESKLARLHYLLTSKASFAISSSIKARSFVEIQLETGRYHQIRAQFAHIGCPIVGDRKYGSALHWKEDEIALHHGRLKFLHPVTQSELCFESMIELESLSFRMDQPIF
jgi:23S rRNA pseudouridine1911/1915/1917 synthase